MRIVDELFDQVQIGYMIVESERLEEWQRFAQNGLGLHLDESTDDFLAFRIDHHRRRLIVRRGPAEDVVTLGLQLATPQALEEVMRRLKHQEVLVTEGSEAGARLRGVRHYHYFDGPKRLGIELFCEPETTDEPLQMLTSGFVTGDGGMGHVAITTRHPESMLNFWETIFDARISDYIVEQIAGNTLDITFLRFNERHHSVAIAAVRTLRLDPIRTRVQHLNLLVNTLDDLVAAYRRLLAMGYDMAHEIGQHPNDKEVSFYVITPSGFELELGWNALTVDEADWQIDRYQGISLWGHKPRDSSLTHFLAVNAGNFRQGLTSLLRKEYTPF